MFFHKVHEEEQLSTERQIAELQRRFRVLENDKRLASEDMQAKIRKQRSVIHRLAKENNKMKLEMKESRHHSIAGPDDRLAHDNLGRMTEKRDMLGRKLEDELELAQHLEGQVGETASRIFSLRSSLAQSGGVNASVNAAKVVRKQIHSLENRLDKTLQRFNEALSTNRKLRENIDSLRRERTTFDSVYRKMQKDLQRRKHEMANIIEQANAAYEARDSAQSQMASLKQQADKEHYEFEREWRELGKLIENDRRMRDYVKMKTAEKESRKKSSSFAMRRSRTLPGTLLPSRKSEAEIESPTSTRTLRRKRTRTTLTPIFLTLDEAKLLTQYEASLAQIQVATGITNIDELLETFITKEDDNFSHFKYNHELKMEIERLRSSIAEYQTELKKMVGEGASSEEKKRLQLFDDMQDRFFQYDEGARSYEIKANDCKRTLEHMTHAVDSIFRRLGLTESSDLPIGTGSLATTKSMPAFLAAIERRVLELLITYNAKEFADDEEEALAAFQMNQQHHANPRQVTVNTLLQGHKLPSTVEELSEDDEDDIEDDQQRPFSLDELKMRAHLKARRAPRVRVRNMAPGGRAIFTAAVPNSGHH